MATPPRGCYSPYKRPWSYSEHPGYGQSLPYQNSAQQLQQPTFQLADLAQVQQYAMQHLGQQAPAMAQPPHFGAQGPAAPNPGPNSPSAVFRSPSQGGRPRQSKDDIQRKKATSACGKCTEIGHWHSDGLCCPEMVLFKNLRDQVLGFRFEICIVMVRQKLRPMADESTLDLTAGYFMT